MERAKTTLFMLMSVDGKISTGALDNLDVDQDFPRIAGVKEGLHQYYEIEQTTNLWSLTSGKIQAKMGANTKEVTKSIPVSFVVIDNHHLTKQGIHYLCAMTKQVVLVTTNENHPAFGMSESNLHLFYQAKLSLENLLVFLKLELGCEAITLQTGGTLNGLLLREKLIDELDIVVAPILIGGKGKDTPTLIDGKAIMQEDELSLLGTLELQECTVLENSYLRLRYKVIG